MTAEREQHGDIASQRAVMVDVGDGFGALVVITPAAFAGCEVRVRPARDDAPVTHVDVHARRTQGSDVMHAAVFPRLRAGAYTVSVAGVALRGSALVEDGRITEVRMRQRRSRRRVLLAL